MEATAENSPKRSITLPTYHRWVLLPFVWLVKLWMYSLHVRTEGDPDLSRPGIFVFWHNRLFVIPLIRKRHLRKQRIHGLISASRDGAWTEALLNLFDIGAIRGSANYRGTQALRELLKVIRAGGNIGIASDGSQGPAYVLKPGAAFLAKATRSPILVVSADFESAWRLKSWDRFFLPKPFSKVTVRFHQWASYEDIGGESVEDSARIMQEKLLSLQSPDLLIAQDSSPDVNDVNAPAPDRS